ncbi:MAG: bifunctional phosphoribosylaminoimidazolecarboxamide formyltransferase/IMP cyclohydrolase PurH [Gammaproteobacteria bacterium PRO9]|nr:bifunctional phosphoribosylaminoimidazolecarboxamide formyltransferase/IMP cyclohydrolase PurH [Gammaproteobacteria bacterium PRO9]
MARALLSVSDKAGIVELASRLRQLGFDLISTGGTAAALRDAGLKVTDVSEITGFPEIMDGRVKTLHPAIHGGLLGRPKVDAGVMDKHGIATIDLLVVNLYPFEATVSRAGCTREDAIENIDIGGPAMLRAAAKNHDTVAVVVDPMDYEQVLTELDADGMVSEATRRYLARKVFAHTATYDAAVFNWLRNADGDTELPANLPIGLRLKDTLRYGENPHQRAGLYTMSGGAADTVVGATLHQGKELSFNNLADADAALECVRVLAAPACVIVKHANPCGVGIAPSAAEAYEKAYATDPTSAFGGIIAFNATVDGALAGTIVERQFVEVIVATHYTREALAALARKPNIRVLETGPLRTALPSTLRVEQLEGGMLVQDTDVAALPEETLKVVSKRQPTAAERADAMFAWQLVRFVKSNAIVFVRDGATIGVGAGQMSRVMSVRIAAWKAEEAGLKSAGAAMASDAFFPFRDGVDLAASFGIRTIIQPGGSMRDPEVIAAADEHGIAMLFTGMRHFRH